MSRRKEIALVTAASAGLMANISSQKFYVNEECIPLQAYEINGSNYVKLRDIGQALDFSVTYAAKTNTVRINPNKPYEEGVAPPSALSKNPDGSTNVPQDGGRYIPQSGDVVRYDKNYFADGPAGSLPEAARDWSRFGQPERPKAEVRRFDDPNGDYLFIRNLYETRRMLYSLYNAMGEDEWIMQSGNPRMRGDGTPWVHIHLTLPDVFKNSKFIRTEYSQH